MPCFKIEYAFVSNKSQRRSRSSLLRSSPAAGAAAAPAATNSTTPGWTPSWLRRQRLSILDWLVTFACPSPSGKLLQFVSYFMRLLLATHMQLRLPGCVCVCESSPVCGFLKKPRTSFALLGKTYSHIWIIIETKRSQTKIISQRRCQKNVTLSRVSSFFPGWHLICI